MIRIILIVAAAALLSGCVTLAKAGSAICDHSVETHAALSIMLSQAQSIPDPTARSLTIKALNVSLRALDGCLSVVSQ